MEGAGGDVGRLRLPSPPPKGFALRDPVFGGRERGPQIVIERDGGKRSKRKRAETECAACDRLPHGGKATGRREHIPGPGMAVPGTPIVAGGETSIGRDSDRVALERLGLFAQGESGQTAKKPAALPGSERQLRLRKSPHSPFALRSFPIKRADAYRVPWMAPAEAAPPINLLVRGFCE